MAHNPHRMNWRHLFVNEKRKDVQSNAKAKLSLLKKLIRFLKR